MKKYIPYATPWCEECKNLKINADSLGNKIAVCRYTCRKGE